MTRGRKPSPLTEIVPVHMNDEVISQDTAAVNEDAKRLAKIDDLYGDGDVYRLEACIQKARFFLTESAEAMLSAGKQLLLIKEHEPHGEFLGALERINITPRSAQKMMQATVKFSRPSNAPLAAHLNKTKLLELMSEEDEELQELGKGGTLAGLTLDDIERMTKYELRAALRKDREKILQDKETHERLLADKNKKIDEYATTLHIRQSLPVDEWEKKVLAELTNAALHARAQYLGVEKVIKEIQEREDAPESVKSACAQVLILGLKAIHEIAQRRFMALDINIIEQEIFPQWMRKHDATETN